MEESTKEIRDQFAMAALTGLLATGGVGDEFGPYATAFDLSDVSYSIADTMMEARKYNNSEGE